MSSIGRGKLDYEIDNDRNIFLLLKEALEDIAKGCVADPELASYDKMFATYGNTVRLVIGESGEILTLATDDSLRDEANIDQITYVSM